MSCWDVASQCIFGMRSKTFWGWFSELDIVLHNSVFLDKWGFGYFSSQSSSPPWLLLGGRTVESDTRGSREEKKQPRGFYLTAEVDNDDTFVALAEWANEGGRLLLAMSQRYGRSVPLSLSLSLEGTKVTHGFLLGDSQPADRASTQSVSIPSKYIFKSSWGSLSCTLD